MTNAKEEITNLLLEDERVEGVCFGPYGWGYAPDEGEEWDTGYGEDRLEYVIPFDKRGVVLEWEEAQGFMEGWSFYGGFGSPDCYATYIWTTTRVFWVTQYDGATTLDWLPRNPEDCMPEMPGG